MHITHTHTHIYIYPVILQNKGYAPGLALGRRGVSSVSHWRLWDLLLHENLLVLFDDLLKPVLAGGHNLRRRVLYMHAIIVMQLFSI